MKTPTKAPKSRSNERQGNGRRFWYDTATIARAASRYYRAQGKTVEAREDDWTDEDCGPSIWVGPKKVTQQTREVLAGIDPASGYWD